MSANEKEKQQIEQDKQQINELLTDLEDKSEDKPLKRSHNSVNISFTQMLAYIDKIRETIPPGDIKFLLQTYRDMAEKFYTQYELSVLGEIKRQSDLQIQSNKVMEYIGKLADNDPEKKELKTAIPLLEKARDDADIEYKKLIKNFPTLLQTALDKLKDEWQRLYTIAVASKKLTEDKDLIQTLQGVVECAAFSVGIEAERIAIVPGDAFALNFFTYLENFAVLTVPIYSVQAPWEWSIFWHELAGFKVRHLENDTVLITIGENLEDLHNLLETIDKDLLTRPDKDLLTEFDKLILHKDVIVPIVTRENAFTHQYISDLFSSKGKLDLSDLGSFEHQFERMLENLPMENKFQNYEQIKADGWCVDWFKELFEDAWSVLEFSYASDEGFLVYFQDILSRHDVTDGRHPPKDIRLSVAKELVKLKADATKPVGTLNWDIEQGATNADPVLANNGQAYLEETFVKLQPTLSEAEEIVTKIAAKQILRFISLIMAADSYRFFKFDTLYEFRELMAEFAARAEILRLVGNNITGEMISWSSNLLAADDSAGEVRDYVKYFIESFAKDTDPELSKKLQLLEKAKKEIVPSYEKLLKDEAGKPLDYEQLLALSFYDRDFVGAAGAAPTTYTFTYLGTTYKLTDQSLKAAMPTYIFGSEKVNSNKIKINGIDHWTTSENVKSMKDLKYI